MKNKNSSELKFFFKAAFLALLAIMLIFAFIIVLLAINDQTFNEFILNFLLEAFNLFVSFLQSNWILIVLIVTFLTAMYLLILKYARYKFFKALKE
jgi:hypothetical protein